MLDTSLPDYVVEAVRAYVNELATVDELARLVLEKGEQIDRLKDEIKVLKTRINNVPTVYESLSDAINRLVEEQKASA